MIESNNREKNSCSGIILYRSVFRFSMLVGVTLKGLITHVNIHPLNYSTYSNFCIALYLIRLLSSCSAVLNTRLEAKHFRKAGVSKVKMFQN